MLRSYICLWLFCLANLFGVAYAQTPASITSTNQAQSQTISQNLDEPILIQRNSPYEVYHSFINATTRLESKYDLYINHKSQEKLKSLLNDLRRIRQLFDLTQVPPATRVRTGDNVITYLYDILARLPTINLETIPGYNLNEDNTSFKDLPERWTIPGTDIQIARQNDGPYSGEYQFSSASVENMDNIYQYFKDLPIINDRKHPFFYELRSNTTGYLIPESFANAFPDWLQKHYFNTPAWKILIIGIINVFLLIAAFIWLRLSFKRIEPEPSIKRSSQLLILPIVLLILLYVSDTFITTQLYPVGRFATGAGILASIFYYGLFAWLAWLFIYFIAALLIGTFRYLSKEYDESLLKLSVKLTAVIAVIIILINGADQLGIPALGILAGFGVGGIAVALASQSTIENIFGGLSIFADRPFRVGEKIYFNKQSAKVLRIGPRSTRLRARDGSLCTVPNSDLAKMHIINFSLRNCCYLDQTIALNNETSTEHIRKLLTMIRSRISLEKLVEHKDGWPRVQLVGTDPGRINIRIRAMVLTSDYSEFLIIQESVMLDVLGFIEQLNLKLAKAIFQDL